MLRPPHVSRNNQMVNDLPGRIKTSWEVVHILLLDLTFYGVLKKKKDTSQSLLQKKICNYFCNSRKGTKKHDSLQKLPWFCFPIFIKEENTVQEVQPLPMDTKMKWEHRIRTQAACVRKGRSFHAVGLKRIKQSD